MRSGASLQPLNGRFCSKHLGTRTFTLFALLSTLATVGDRNSARETYSEPVFALIAPFLTIILNAEWAYGLDFVRKCCARLTSKKRYTQAEET